MIPFRLCRPPDANSFKLHNFDISGSLRELYHGVREQVLSGVSAQHLVLGTAHHLVFGASSTR